MAKRRQVIRSRVSREVALKADIAFCRALPKIELHAHLSGSISRDFLHDIWLAKQDECSDLEDPLDAIRPNGVHHDVLTYVNGKHEEPYFTLDIPKVNQCDTVLLTVEASSHSSTNTSTT